MWLPKRRVAKLVNVAYDVLHPLLERDFRRPVQLCLDFSDVRKRAIGFSRALWNVNDGASQQFHEAIDAIMSPTAHVEEVIRKGRLGCGIKSMSDILNVSKIPRLGSVSYDCVGFVVELLSEKGAEDGAVDASGARSGAKNVEEAE